MLTIFKDQKAKMSENALNKHMTWFENEVRNYCKTRMYLKVVKWG